jgi:hypothetical protein
VHAYAQTAARESQGARAACDSRADHRDVGTVEQGRCNGRTRLDEPERNRLHATMLLERAVEPIAFDGRTGKLELGKSSRNVGGRKSARPDELVHPGGQALQQ